MTRREEEKMKAYITRYMANHWTVKDLNAVEFDALMDRLVALISPHAKQVLKTGWRPIDKRAKNGRWILIARPDGIPEMVRWKSKGRKGDEEAGWFTRNGQRSVYCTNGKNRGDKELREATHWQPLGLPGEFRQMLEEQIAFAEEEAQKEKDTDKGSP